MRRLKLTRVLIAGLLVGCTDAAAPNLFGPLQPEFAIVPSSAIPNGQFGAAGSSSIIKGFNPVNPHVGDAVIATFFWTGSATITSVIDHETNGKPVGNTYNLVETRSSGGVNMATYVAFNVQGFPDAFDERVRQGDSILVVQANMSGPVNAGGIIITAWSGVQPTLALGLGAHSSGNGSSTTQTIADPGTIAVNPGALIYAVTMGDQVVGMDPPPPPFVNITNQSDNASTMKGDAERMIQGGSAGTSHPTWVWGFNSPTPRTWLATVLALNEAPTGSNQAPTAAFSSSCSALTCSFTNTSSDPDGSIASNSWNFGDGQTSTTASPSHSYAAAGTYTVTLTVTDNQGATNAVSHGVTVTQANQSPTAAFSSSCSALTCSFTNTSSDPDGSIASNSWNFGDGQTSTTASPSHSYAAAGTYTVTLTVTDNQGATNAVSHGVTVTQANQSPTAAFSSSCSALTCSFTNTSSDPDGSIASNSWNFGDGQTSTTASPSHTYGAAGTYTVTLTVTDNQGATGSVQHTVTVSQANQPPTANFTFSCNNLNCGFTSTSSDPDGSITAYSWTFGDGGTSTAQNPSHTYGAGGSYTVTLRVTDNQGAQSPTTSKTVTVTAPNQPPTANFTFSCNGLSCGFTSTSSDPDGSIASYSWNFGDGGTSTAQNPSHTYATGGTRTVTLTVTDNRGATNSRSQSVTVTLPNRPPVVNAGADQVVLLSLLGVTYTLNASFSDPDNDGPWSYTINWGDGNTSTGTSSSQGTISASHHYANVISTRTVTVTVRDAHGASGSDSKVLTLIL